MITLSRRWFLPVIALLMTGYVTALSLSVMTLVVRDQAMSRSLWIGLANYSASEGAFELALLKAKYHRSGFSDQITSSDDDRDLLRRDLPSYVQARKVSQIGYKLDAAGSTWSGSISTGADAFEIIPLFIDIGTVATAGQNPKFTATGSILEKTTDFTMTLSSEIVWNIIGENGSGTTEGISGTGGIIDGTSVGTIRVKSGRTTVDFSTSGSGELSGNDDLIQSTLSIADFLSSHINNYLIAYNPSTSRVDYSFSASPGASRPTAIIRSEATIDRFRQILTVTENRSALLDTLKYALFDL